MKNPYRDTGFWQPKPSECAALRDHLLAELPLGHVLDIHRKTLAVTARDTDGDRVVVEVGDGRRALVEMSWTGRPAMAPFLPETRLFESEAELLEAIRAGVAP